MKLLFLVALLLLVWAVLASPFLLMLYFTVRFMRRRSIRSASVIVAVFALGRTCADTDHHGLFATRICHG